MLIIRQLGALPLPPVYQAMRAFTDQRGPDTPDELWLLEHPPVYTQGLNGRPEHLLTPSEIPVIAIDRGGQITYHGPGQLVLYCLLDLKRAGIGFGVRKLVCALEQAVIALLAEHRIDARGRRDAPGVYVGARKLASLGLRVRRGCSYHGLSLNVNMDLTPFTFINPCGYAGLRMTQLSELGLDWSVEQTGAALSRQLQQSLITHLGDYFRYTAVEYSNHLSLSDTQETPHATAASYPHIR